jgi:alkylated DNA repair dioxygenase AlkB
MLIEELPYGVMLMRGALDNEEQKQVLRSCMSLQSPEKLTPSKDSRQFTPFIYHNWPSSFQVPRTTQPSPGESINEAIPQLFDFGMRMHHAAVQYWLRHPHVGYQRDFTQEALYGILYGPESVLESHQDIQGGWVISMSIGAACEFFFSPKAESGSLQTHIVLNSGDVIIFNGRKLFHGVSKVFSDQIPDLWVQEWPQIIQFKSCEEEEDNKEEQKSQYIRLNVQFRYFQESTKQSAA